MTTATEQAQQGFEESDLEDLEIKIALEDWQKAKEVKAEAEEVFKNAEKMMQATIGAKNLEDGTYRVGAFLVVIATVARHQRVKPRLDVSKKKKSK